MNRQQQYNQTQYNNLQPQQQPEYGKLQTKTQLKSSSTNSSSTNQYKTPSQIKNDQLTSTHIDARPMFLQQYGTKENKTCHSDYATASITHPKLDLNSPKTEVLDTVSFAPFLMWNVHDSKYFENTGKINTMIINDNTIYDTSKSCNLDTNNYAELMQEAFFSAENMDIIQNTLIKTVFYRSGETLRINKIKQETLIQCMNHIWTNFCRFLPYDLKGQIEELDDKVVEYLTPLLLKEYTFYKNYLRDSDRTNLPQLERPIMIAKGRKQQMPSFYK
jgi:hypothetical protein